MKRRFTTYMRGRGVRAYLDGRGVYGIVHQPSGRMYVGGASKISTRLAHHVCNLRRGSHCCAELQRLWTRDGEASFQFILLEAVEKKSAIRAREQWWHDRGSSTLNTVKGVTTLGQKLGPSEAGKAAARRRWANPAYRSKRQAWLDDRTEQGRFKPQVPVPALSEV